MQNLKSAIEANEVELIWNIQLLDKHIKYHNKFSSSDKHRIHELLNGYLTIQYDQNLKLKEVRTIISKYQQQNDGSND